MRLVLTLILHISGKINYHQLKILSLKLKGQ